MTRGLQAVVLRRRLLDPRRHGFYAYQLVNHKVLRRLMGVPAAARPGRSAPSARRGRGSTGGAGGAARRVRPGLVGAGPARRPHRPAAASAVSPATSAWSTPPGLVAAWNVLSGHRIDQWEPRAAPPGRPASAPARSNAARRSPSPTPSASPDDRHPAGSWDRHRRPAAPLRQSPRRYRRVPPRGGRPPRAPRRSPRSQSCSARGASPPASTVNPILALGGCLVALFAVVFAAPRGRAGGRHASLRQRDRRRRPVASRPRLGPVPVPMLLVISRRAWPSANRSSSTARLDGRLLLVQIVGTLFSREPEAERGRGQHVPRRGPGALRPAGQRRRGARSSW